MDQETLRAFYADLIQDDFVPYWSRFADREKGGVLNCIDNQGVTLLTEWKFTWSQGRYLWLLGRLYELAGKGVLPKLDRDDLREQMIGTYDFITRYAIYGDSLCCYLLDRDGNRLPDKKTGRLDASIFADCFALIGMAQHVAALELSDQEATVDALYRSIVQRIESGEYATEPYPIPAGYRIHSIPMILLNTTYEYMRMRKRLGLDTGAQEEIARRQVEAILDGLWRDGLIREHVSNEENYKTRLLDRHLNPGHSLEDIWFIGEFLEEYGGLSERLPRLVDTAKRSFDLGWDQEFGGLLRFVDREGGHPKGVAGDSDFEKLIADTWDMKLWWPHSETLYVFLYLYRLTGEEELLERYRKAEEYVFRTFPNRDAGEWIQIRRRDGTPEEKLVALPVKDPFHILRNFIKIVELRGRDG